MLIREEKGFTLLEMLVSSAIIFVLVASIYQILSSFSRNFEIQDAIAEMQQQGRFSADLISREIRRAGYDPTSGFFNTGLNVGNPDNNCNGVDAPATVERILEAGPTVFHYLADLNENGRPFTGNPNNRDPNEHVRYEWVGSLEDDSGKGADVCGKKHEEYTLYRNTGGGMQQVSSDIVTLNFQYFDEGNAPIPVAVLDAAGNPIPNTRTLTANERSDIWRVILTLTARTDRPDKDYPINNGYRTRIFVYDIWLKNA